MVSSLLGAWSERSWPLIFFIIYLMVAVSVGLQSGFALLVMLICLQPLVPYYPIGFLRGAALQDLFFLAGLPLLLLSIPFQKERLKTVLPLALPYLCLAAWAALGALATQDNLPDFLVALAKGSGRPVIIALACLLTGAALKNFERSEVLLKAITLTSAFEALLGITAMMFNLEIIAGGLHLGVQNLPYPLAPGLALSRRLHGTFSTGNLTGAYFVVTLPLALSFFVSAKTTKQKMLWLTSAILQLVALVLTFTRASIVACVFAFLVLGVMSGRGKLKIMFQVLVVLAIGYFVMVSIIPEIPNLVAGRFLGARIEARLAPAWAGLKMIADYPLWGVGVDNSVPIMETDPRYSLTPFGETTVRPHNSFIFIGAELGIPASLILLWAVIAITRFILRARRFSRETKTELLSAAVMSGWMGEILHSFTNNLFHHPSLMVTHIAVITALTPLFFNRGYTNVKQKERRELI